LGAGGCAGAETLPGPYLGRIRFVSRSAKGSGRYLPVRTSTTSRPARGAPPASLSTSSPTITVFVGSTPSPVSTVAKKPGGPIGTVLSMPTTFRRPDERHATDRSGLPRRWCEQRLELRLGSRHERTKLVRTGHGFTSNRRARAAHARDHPPAPGRHQLGRPSVQSWACLR
jgi:hypothetical protein